MAANWDFALEMGDGKILILEDKGTSPVQRSRVLPLQTHRIDIDRHQLDWYCDEVEGQHDLPVYYVLPKPPWLGDELSSPVPEQAAYRVASPDGPFEEWSFVISCNGLRRQLDGGSSLETQDLPAVCEQTFSEFLKRVQDCEFGLQIRGGHRERSSTKEVLVRAESIADSAARQHTNANRKMAGSMLAVFIPASDLPGWNT